MGVVSGDNNDKDNDDDDDASADGGGDDGSGGNSVGSGNPCNRACNTSRYNVHAVEVYLSRIVFEPRMPYCFKNLTHAILPPLIRILVMSSSVHLSIYTDRTKEICVPRALYKLVVVVAEKVREGEAVNEFVSEKVRKRSDTRTNERNIHGDIQPINQPMNVPMLSTAL